MLTIPTKGDIIYPLPKGKRCGRGGIGRRARLRIWWFHRGGSSPFARTIIFHIRNKITVFPDSVRFALLSRGWFFVCLMEGVAKRLGVGGEIIEDKENGAEV